MTLNEKIMNLIELQHQEEELTNKIDSIKAEILAEMNKEDIKSVSTDVADVTKAFKTTYSYTDETAIMQYLHDHGLNSFIETKIAKTAFNKELAKHASVYEALNDKVKTSETAFIKVKEKKPLTESK